MYDASELVKRNKIQNLVLSFFILVFCLINIILNIDNYRSVITGECKTITSIKELKKAKDRKDLFIFVDMKNAKLENYSLKSDIKINTYTINLNKNNIIVLLKEDTLLTSKVPVQIIKENDNIKDLKSKIETKYEDDYILSDMNYVRERKINIYKTYILIGLFFISIISVLVNLIGVLNPEKTLLYKIYNKNYY